MQFLYTTPQKQLWKCFFVVVVQQSAETAEEVQTPKPDTASTACLLETPLSLRKHSSSKSEIHFLNFLPTTASEQKAVIFTIPHDGTILKISPGTHSQEVGFVSAAAFRRSDVVINRGFVKDVLLRRAFCKRHFSLCLCVIYLFSRNIIMNIALFVLFYSYAPLLEMKPIVCTNLISNHVQMKHSYISLSLSLM